MGNQICCEEVSNSKEDKIVIYVGHQEDNSPTKTNIKAENQQKVSVPKQYVAEPIVSEKIRENLQKFNPFNDQINSHIEPIKINSTVYRGPLDQSGKPDGFGKMFYPNGSVLIGKFVNGVPNGPAHYVWPNGSFYKGVVENNRANDNVALYECDDYVYQGSIKNNSFEGEGTLKAKDQSYQFSGLFENGKRKYGKLTWKQAERGTLPLSSSQVEYDAEYSYEGNFDQNQEFTGKGTLTGPKGVYRGQFQNGKRNGQGVFEYASGLKYEGTYKNDEREGKGIIYSKSKLIAFEGEMKNGLPHGRGKSVGMDGQYYEVDWNQGICSIVEEAPNKV